MAVTTSLAQAAAPWTDIAPTVAEGRIERLGNISSRHVDSRPIDVWLPADYTPAKRYAVLYMQDGQMLFDANQSWNKQAWNVHLTLARLMQEGKVRDTIVVGIPNNGKYRYSEYYPEKYLALMPAEDRENYVRRAQWGKTLADVYLRFIVEELKPAIDQKYATRSGPDGTFVMGSSMGGMISLYAVCEYPQVFGGAAAMSTHWIGRPGAWGPPEKLQNATMPLAAFQYLQKQLPPPGKHRLYFDHGTTGLDAVYGVHQSYADEVGRERGYTATQWLSRVFEGTGHSEADWSARLETPLTFLLAK